MHPRLVDQSLSEQLQYILVSTKGTRGKEPKKGTGEKKKKSEELDMFPKIKDPL